VPQDFEEKRESYYQDLSLPPDADEFIGGIQERMKAALSAFNETLPKNRKVSLRQQGRNLIKLSPMEPQPEPKFLQHLKARVTSRWPMTNLLDIVKEADVQVGFTDEFRGLGDWDPGPEDLATAFAVVPVCPWHQHRPETGIGRRQRSDL